MTSLEIWIYQDDRPVARHGALNLQVAVQALGNGRDLLDEAMDRAMADVQAGRFAVTPPRQKALA